MGRCVLVVDDDPLVLRVASATLLRHGYGVLSASDAATAFALAEKFRPDAVLADIMLPGGEDGGGLAQRLAELGPIPVIFLSSLVEAPDVRGVRAGRPPYLLPKPLVAAELLALLERVLAQPGEEGAE